MDKYKKEIEHFGMLQDYNDSEDYLRKNPHLACEDTANYLALWCISLEVQEVIFELKFSQSTIVLLVCSRIIVLVWVTFRCLVERPK